MIQVQIARKSRSAPLLVLLLALSTLVSRTESAATLILRPLLITTMRGSQTFPTTDGRTVVWIDDRRPSSRTTRVPSGDVVGMDVKTGREFAITERGTAFASPALSDGVVVWLDCRRCKSSDRTPGYGGSQIYGKDLGSGREFQISGTEDQASQPAISGHTVVWVEARTGPGRIMGKDLVTGRVFRVSVHQNNQANPAISGDIVVWQEYGGGYKVGLYAKELATGREFPVALSTSSQPVRQNAAIDGHVVVWTDLDPTRPDQGTSIMAQDLATHRLFRVACIPDNSYNPQTGLTVAISGDIVVWSAAPAHQNWYTQSHIFSKDLLTGQVLQLSGRPHAQVHPSIGASTVVWEDYDSRSIHVRGVILSRH